MKTRGRGRLPEAAVARTKYFTVRLTPAEKAAIKTLERNLADLVRKAAAEQMKLNASKHKASAA